MRRERLKDQIEDPRESLFDTLVRAIVILICIGAVYYAFSGRGLAAPRRAATTDSAPVATSASKVTLTATRNHTFYWNAEGPIPLSAAGARLSAWLKTARAPEVVIAGDESVRLGDTRELLGAAHRAGVKKVRLTARPRATP